MSALGHGNVRPSCQTLSSTLTQILVVGLFLALHVQQTVATPQFGHAHWTHGYLLCLAVFHQQVTDADAAAWHARQTGQTSLPTMAFGGMRNSVFFKSI